MNVYVLVRLENFFWKIEKADDGAHEVKTHDDHELVNYYKTAYDLLYLIKQVRKPNSISSLEMYDQHWGLASTDKSVFGLEFDPYYLWSGILIKVEFWDAW